MYLVERHIVDVDNELHKECDRVCFLSKNLYNYANYLVRQEFIGTSKKKEAGELDHATYLNYNAINKQLIAEAQVDYTALPRKVSNETLKQLHGNWLSFFASIKDWNKNPEKYKGRPKLPGYLDKKDGRFKTTFEFQAISKTELKKGYIKLSGTTIKFPYMHRGCQPVEARIIAQNNNRYVIEVIYKQEAKELKTDGSKCGVDIGVNNLMAVAFNTRNTTPVLVNGRPLKSINQYYNKEKAILQSALTKQFDSKRQISKAINKLTNKRNNKANDYLHKASSVFMQVLLKHNVSVVVIGKNNDWKNEINIGSANNQMFVSIPHARLIRMIQYKCALEGIQVIVRDESYTSVSSFIDLDEIPTYSKQKEQKFKFSGRRIKRGLYKSKNGILINADINGAYNILRKEFPNDFVNGIEGFAVNPYVVRYVERFK